MALPVAIWTDMLSQHGYPVKKLTGADVSRLKRFFDEIDSPEIVLGAFLSRWDTFTQWASGRPGPSAPHPGFLLTHRDKAPGFESYLVDLEKKELAAYEVAELLFDFPDGEDRQLPRNWLDSIIEYTDAIGRDVVADAVTINLRKGIENPDSHFVYFRAVCRNKVRDRCTPPASWRAAPEPSAVVEETDPAIHTEAYLA